MPLAGEKTSVLVNGHPGAIISGVGVKAVDLATNLEAAKMAELAKALPVINLVDKEREIAGQIEYYAGYRRSAEANEAAAGELRNSFGTTKVAEEMQYQLSSFLRQAASDRKMIDDGQIEKLTADRNRLLERLEELKGTPAIAAYTAAFGDEGGRFA